jgi:hypothetical protein
VQHRASGRDVFITPHPRFGDVAHLMGPRNE